jgi:[lysine-biosynthesis-protein LysW]--L-2-aminoadipate ligase
LGAVTEGKSASSLTILYDNIRWEEKSLYEAAKKKGVEISNVDCRNLSIDLNNKNSQYWNKTIIQRTVSYFKSLHSTAALEGVGAHIINSLRYSLR